MLEGVYLAHSKNITFNILHEESTTEMMKSLLDIYENLRDKQGISNVNFFNLKLEEGASIAKHTKEFIQITILLSLVNINFNNKVSA